MNVDLVTWSSRQKHIVAILKKEYGLLPAFSKGFFAFDAKEFMNKTKCQQTSKLYVGKEIIRSLKRTEKKQPAFKLILQDIYNTRNAGHVNQSTDENDKLITTHSVEFFRKTMHLKLK